MSNEVKNLFLAEVVTPEKVVFSGQVEMIRVPGSAGEFAVLAKHIPLISSIGAGVVSVFLDDQVKHNFFVFDGFIEVSTYKSIVLVENAIDLYGQSVATVQEKINEIENDLAGNNQDYQNYFFAKKLDFYKEMLKTVKGL
jgi:F-type H+-transporting ATPase subunit epsilon